MSSSPSTSIAKTDETDAVDVVMACLVNASAPSFSHQAMVWSNLCRNQKAERVVSEIHDGVHCGRHLRLVEDGFAKFSSVIGGTGQDLLECDRARVNTSVIEHGSTYARCWG